MRSGPFHPEVMGVVDKEAAGGVEEPGFRVTDRRGTEREESHEPSEAEAPPERGGAPPPEAREAEAEGADIRSLPVGHLVRVFIAELHARAWIHMGLVVDPATNLVGKDLAQARLAIDCIGGLVEQIAPAAAKPERDEMERMLADLRINFLRQSGV